MSLSNITGMIGLLSILISCRESTGSKYNGDKNSKKHVSKELHEGPIKYYDSDNNLINITNFKMGRKNGPCVNYFLNGKISDSGFYFFDLADGYWTFFDSTGNRIYCNYYYKNLEYGPQLWFKNNLLTKFEFLSFDKNTITTINYKSTGKFDSLVKFDMGFNILEKNKDDLDLFAYLPRIPGVDQHFAIGVKNNANTKELFPLGGNDYIIDTILRPPPVGWNYYISCHIQDKPNSYNKIFLELMVVKHHSR